MPAAVAVPLISAGVGAAATAYGAHSINKGNSKASEFEYKAQTEALDDARKEREYQRGQDRDAIARGEEAKNYSRGQYADYLGRLSPYANAGSKAVTGLSNGLPSPQAVGAQVGNGPMIQILGPNGKTYQVPASQREHWLSKGAQIVGGR